ncbi:hypothetical protein L3Q82_024408, partial [Scortum barcoo]
PVKVIVMEDSDAILPCSLGSGVNIESRLFDWRKDYQKDGSKDVFMYDGKKQDLLRQSEQFRGRVSHFPDELKNGNASIKITKTKLADGGNYTCIFPNLQPQRKFNIELVVGAAPEPIIRTLEFTKDRALLQCEVLGASPKPQLQWQDSDGNLVPAKDPQEEKRGGSYDIILQATVTKTNNYSCVVTQKEINHQTQAHIYVSFNGAQAVLPEERPDVPRELKRRRRGRRAGVERRARRRRYRPVLPSIIMGNVRSLPNKMDKRLRTRLPNWTASLSYGRTEARTSGKRKGGGLAVFVNDRWCKPGHITIKEQHCCKDIELLAVSMRPYYLPREFTHALVVVVYVPPSANADASCDVLLSAVSRLQTQHCDALLLISGDFNHASPSSSLPKFTQYASHATPETTKHWTCFMPAPRRHTTHSLFLPWAEPTTTSCTSCLCISLLCAQAACYLTCTVKKWSEEAEEALKDCFNTTLWDVFSNAHGEDIDSLTHCLTDYIKLLWRTPYPPGLYWRTSPTASPGLPRTLRLS